MTLYLKYRPQTVDELDLPSVRENLKNIIKSGDIPHAFLFSGPKGTGKTSAARILAKIINCTNLGKDGEPCNKCDMCLSIIKGNNIDIIELDGASNRGIDDIRNLKEGIYLAPVAAARKVYIIDEAHMLTLEAANAFLKTLEEPPDHVVFILATTNPEKLPATVISRLTQIIFTKATLKDVSRQLKRVAKGEKIKINNKAIEKIAKLADGSFRDAVKILEKLSFKTKNITEKDIAENESDIQSFFKILAEKNGTDILKFIEELVKNGIQMRSFLEDLLGMLHESLLAKNGLGEDYLSDFSIEELVALNELLSYARVESSPVDQLPFEIAVVKFISGRDVSLSSQTESGDSLKSDDIKNERDSLPTQGVATSVGVTNNFDDSIWQKILQNIRSQNVSVEALLRSSKPISFDGKDLLIGVYYQFHKDKLEDGRNMNILRKTCMETFGIDSIKIVFKLIEKPRLSREPALDKSAASKDALSTGVEKDIIDAAKEIFG